jgi:hypothetical protein
LSFPEKPTLSIKDIDAGHVNVAAKCVRKSYPVCCVKSCILVTAGKKSVRNEEKKNESMCRTDQDLF